MPRPQTSLPHANFSIDSQSVGNVELKIRSREEEILRELGILHLDEKATRPARNRHRHQCCGDDDDGVEEYETDAAILKEAGVYYVNTEEYDRMARSEEEQRKRRSGQRRLAKMNSKLKREEVEMLRDAGVTWLDDMAVVHEDDTYSHRLMDDIHIGGGHDGGGCEQRTVATSCLTTASGVTTIEGTTVNGTYAERELNRRLKRGWTSAGEDCERCGMKVIFDSSEGRNGSSDPLLECVICGVVTDGQRQHGGKVEEEERDQPEFLEEDGHDGECRSHGPEEEEEEDIASIVDEIGSRGVFDVWTNMSALTPIHHGTDEGFDGAIITRPVPETVGEETNHQEFQECQECQEGDHLAENDDRHGGDGEVHSHQPPTRTVYDLVFDEKRRDDDDDEAYKEEIGLRLFEGWEMTKLSCPNCNLPLMSNGEDAPCVCLRCGM